MAEHLFGPRDIERAAAPLYAISEVRLDAETWRMILGSGLSPEARAVLKAAKIWAARIEANIPVGESFEQYGALRSAALAYASSLKDAPDAD